MSEQSGESNVTFVAGQPVEQTTEGAGSGIADGERSAAVAAVREALQKVGEESAKEAASVKNPMKPEGMVTEEEEKAAAKAKSDRDDKGRFLPKQTPVEPTAEEDDDAPSLKKVLQNRQAVAHNKKAQADEAQRAMAELSQLRQQIAREQQYIAQERARLERLRSDPVQAIRDNGWDPEEFIMTLAREGTPEGAEARRQRELQAQIQEMKSWKEQQEARAREQQQQYEAQKKQHYRQVVEREFIKTAMDDSFAPNVASFYKGKEALLVAQGDAIAEQYRALTGKEATFPDIVEYLEEQLTGWYKGRVGSQQAQTTPIANALGTPVAVSPTTGVTGRTLNPAATTERRTLGTVLKDLDGDERIEAAREAVSAALRAAR
jgi:hypothetical protein